jgi:hypothetical protein
MSGEWTWSLVMHKDGNHVSLAERSDLGCMLGIVAGRLLRFGPTHRLADRVIRMVEKRTTEIHRIEIEPDLARKLSGDNMITDAWFGKEEDDDPVH